MGDVKNVSLMPIPFRAQLPAAEQAAPLPQEERDSVAVLMDEILDSYSPSGKGSMVSDQPAEPLAELDYLTDADVMEQVRYTNVGDLYHAPNAARYRDEDESSVR